MPPPKPSPERLFPTTSQTLIERLQTVDPETREVSLEQFCQLYYPAIYGFGRRLGLTAEDAQDRTQDFFMEVVKDRLLDKFERSRGTRFSTWLMRCFKNLAINHRTARTAQKRGGGLSLVAFDPEHAEHSYQSAQSSELPPGMTFDLMLARSLWQMTLQQLRRKHADSENAAFVNALLPFLLHERWPGPPAPSQQELAQQHHKSAVALKAFFNRTLKSQAQRIFDAEAASANPGITVAEIAELWALLCQHGEE